jgi:UDP-N-acetylmuramoyl-tripeptide--D-alanyl-D-alanine ligase
LHLSHEHIARGIAHAKPYFGRTQIIRGDVAIIQDCYNANPSSMNAALTFFAGLSVTGKKIAVLGDMFELGNQAPEAHEQVLKAIQGKIHTLVLIGNEMSGAFSRLSLQKEGITCAKNVVCFDSWDDEHIARAADTLTSIMHKGDTVLIKGSRSTGLERLTERLEMSL